MIYAITILNISLVAFYFYEKRKSKVKHKRMLHNELKYQRHLRNAFDYQIQMYAFMDSHDPDGFKLAADQVSEELNKCEQILKNEI